MTMDENTNAHLTEVNPNHAIIIYGVIIYATNLRVAFKLNYPYHKQQFNIQQFICYRFNRFIIISEWQMAMPLFASKAD